MTDWWTRMREGATDMAEQTGAQFQVLAERTNEQLQRARESEAWQNASEQAQVTRRSLTAGAQSTWENTKSAMGLPEIQVVFTSSTLGMTLAKHESSGRPVVVRVDEQGAASRAGVVPGSFVVAMRAGEPDDGTTEATIRIETYDQLMGLFPSMGRPVTIRFSTPLRTGKVSTGGIVNFNLEDEMRKATGIVEALTSEQVFNPDAVVPQAILQQAHGLAFIRVAKVGLFLSVRGGTGLVVARLASDMRQWSAPCAIATGGVGWGFQFGAEVTDIMIVLNTREAIDAFASGNQVTLGGTVGIALGPVGRNTGLGAYIHGGQLSQTADGQPVPVHLTPCYSYSHSKGLFFGVSLEGAVIHPRKDINSKFYGRAITPGEILNGGVPAPVEANEFYRSLAQGMSQERLVSYPPPPYPHAQPVSHEPTGAFPQEPSSENPFAQAAQAQAAGDAAAVGALPTDDASGPSSNGQSTAAAAAVAATEASLEGEFPPVPGRRDEL